MGMYFEFLFDPETYPGQESLANSLLARNIEEGNGWTKRGEDGVEYVWRDFYYCGLVNIADRLFGELIDGRRIGGYVRLSSAASFDDLPDILNWFMELGGELGFALYDGEDPITNKEELKAVVARYKKAADNIRKNWG